MKKELLQLSRMILKLAEMPTDKGVLISDDEIAVDREVFIEDENGELVAAPDGEYTAEDGRVFVVAEGKVVEIKEAEQKPEEAPVEETPAEDQLAEESEETPESDPKDDEIARLQAQIEELNNVIVEKDEEIGRLRAELESKNTESEELKSQLKMSDEKPAEEKFKSQNEEKKSWVYKPRF